METPDKFDEIASRLLLSDADLALTFIRIALGRPDGNARNMGLRHAAVAYRQICESICIVKVQRDELRVLGEKLEELRSRLDEADQAA